VLLLLLLLLSRVASLLWRVDLLLSLGRILLLSLRGILWLLLGGELLLIPGIVYGLLLLWLGRVMAHWVGCRGIRLLTAVGGCGGGCGGCGCRGRGSGWLTGHAVPAGGAVSVQADGVDH
jgi:hypothetical protein